MALSYPELTPLSNLIIGCAIEVHTHLGPGLLESIYEECLAVELEQAGCKVDRQPQIPVRYKGRTLSAYYRPDVLVDRKIILEVKSVEKMSLVHAAQVRTCLRITGLRLGFLFNFNSVTLPDGMKRIVL